MKSWKKAALISFGLIGSGIGLAADINLTK